MNNYLPASGERRLDSAKLDSFKYRLDKAMQHTSPGQEAKKESLERKRQMMDNHTHKVDKMANFFGITDPRNLPESEDLLIRLFKLGEFADDLLSPPITPTNFSGLTQADVYDLQAPNLTNAKDNFYFVAFVGIHKYVSSLLGIEPRTGLTGAKWTGENKKFRRAESFEEVYQKRERLLTGLHVLPFTAEVPENMDFMMDRLLKDDKFAGVKVALNKAVDRIFQRSCGEEDCERHLRYFLTEVLFFASQDKDRTISFHFGTDIEAAWDLTYNHILVHEKSAFEELCKFADIEPKQSANFSGLSYERPSLYLPRTGRERIKPYDPDPSLKSWIPEIGDDKIIIEKKLDNASQENLIILGSGLFYASRDVPELRDVLRSTSLYRGLEECLSNGIYPHRRRFMDKKDVSQMLAAASDYFRGVL